MSETRVAEPPAENPAERAKQLAQQIYELVRDRRQAALARRLLRSAALLSGRAEVVAVGTRSVGKSSLLNALLDRPDLLPVDVDVSSNVYVRIGYGPAPEGAPDPGGRIRVQFADEKEPVEDGLAALADWASEAGNPNNRRGVGQVQVRVAAPICEQGLVLTDTPGAGGLVAGHAEAVRAACRQADGLLVVLDHVQPISETVLDFLRSLGDQRRVVLAFNKTDTAGDTAASIADTRELLDRAGLAHIAAAPMIGTSSFLAHEASALGDAGEPDAEMLADSGIPDLRRALTEAILEPVRREQVRALLADLGDVLRTLAAPDTGLLRQAPGGQAVTEEAVNELRRLLALDPRRELESRLGSLLRDSDATLREAIAEAVNGVEDQVNSRFTPAVRDGLPGLVLDGINAAWLSAVGPMSEAIAVKAAEVGLGIELELPESGLPGFAPEPDLPPVARPEGKAGRVLNRMWKVGWKVLVTGGLYAPLAVAEWQSEKKAERTDLDRQAARIYLVRERDKALRRLPGKLTDEYHSHARTALGELESARDARLEALQAVREAVENPPSPSQIEEARARLAALRALDDRVRALAAEL
ncbi:MAG: dynamin family protein [Dehalococcoidia bacterium]